jgi:MscS family membrane protein
MSFASVLSFLVLTHPVGAQIPGAGGQATAPSQQQAADPLERTTPRGTISAFIRAVQRDDYVLAARYLQVNESQRRSTEPLARDLKSLMDRYFSEPITSVSDSPEGALDDGLPIDRERVGPLTINDTKTDIALVRVTDPQVGQVWLISSETLALVPALNRSVARTLVERVMPDALVRREVFGISLAHWIVLVATLVIPLILFALLTTGLVFVVRRMLAAPSRRHDFDVWYSATRWPAIAVVVLAIQVSSLRFLGYPLAFRITYAHLGLIAAVLAMTWLLRRVLTLGFARARNMVWGKDRTSTRSLMLLGEKLLKALVVVVAILAILTIAGVNTKTALAGLGIGGVALALGAQKTVENFLGGVFLLSDRVLAVGDTCSISNRLGTVEDITLRSVRLRTLDQTLVSVPAGVLAQAGIENFASREKILAQTVLRLRYGTSAQQLKRILDGVRELLAANPKIEKGSARIRLINFGERALELELFAYVLTADFAEFLAVREGLFLEIASTVEAAGSAFAQPTEFIYVDGESTADVPVGTSTRRDAAVPDDVRLTPSISSPGADTKLVQR